VNEPLPTYVRSARPRIAIVTPVFNEQECLPLYEQAVRERLLSRSDYDFDILFVDDGSQDRSWELICCICQRDSRFRGIRLSRNFGGHIADSAGLAHVDGDAVAILASDLQDPPEVILQFLEKWRAGAQIVWGRRRGRNDQTWRKFTSELFLKLVRRFAMPAGSKMTSGGFFLLDRKVLDSLLQFEERSRIVFALVAWTGFEQTVVEYDRGARAGGRSGWGLNRMIRSMYDVFIGFSLLPVRLMTLSGIAMFLLSVPWAAYMVINWWTSHPLPGWSSIMLALALLFGFQFLLMGIAGEYLYRIYTEVVHRPLYLISQETQSAADSKAVISVRAL
jgi:glycosyltransferase involved in cell wall biosynthesis